MVTPVPTGKAFGEGTMLQQANWIEVTGKMDLSLFEKRVTTTYSIYYIVKFQMHLVGILPRVKPDVWKELRGGEFSISNSITGGNVEFGMFEEETDWWKGSMVLAGIKINPKTP
ncbi:LOW QUALITY PROTEIN: hypothetical protein RJ639_028496 [Escallonia herrerae]|uniref:Uncharacterized protein n=1 Tax=Escallonia herrerae TaxID=1293975 RepID=A0AA89BRE9_9ASTE|nr:LOW QUALITY PROTEIN: hypothetical protein RJ639_028496 [Escallonia herrerae]